jgi:hypothetical protein
MDLEEVEVDMIALRLEHGEQKFNNIPIHQLCKLQRDLLKGKGLGASQASPSSTTGQPGDQNQPPQASKKESKGGEEER